MSRIQPRRPTCYDLGVTATGPSSTFTRVAFKPAAGQYTSDDWTGERIFSSANNRRPVTISCAVWTGQVYFPGTLNENIQS